MILLLFSQTNERILWLLVTAGNLVDGEYVVVADCRFCCHKKCADQVPKNCRGEAVASA